MPRAALARSSPIGENSANADIAASSCAAHAIVDHDGS